MAYKLGVLGKDISYSLSPKIHQEFAKQLNCSIEYLIYNIDKDPVNFVHEFFDNEGFGLNITKPFKHIVAKEFNPDLESINCIYGKGTKACSTDGAGLLNDLESKKIDYQNMNILVYGLGGAATSILETINSNKKIFISNRTEKKSSELIGKKNNLDKYDGEQLDLIISCASSLDLNTLKNFEHFSLNEGGFIYDINYSNDTNFKLKDLSLSKKANFYNGVGMLVEQAALSFKEWFGIIPTKEIKNKIKNERL